jgi:hypothetical protein
LTNKKFAKHNPYQATQTHGQESWINQKQGKKFAQVHYQDAPFCFGHGQQNSPNQSHRFLQAIHQQQNIYPLQARA